MDLLHYQGRVFIVRSSTGNNKFIDADICLILQHLFYGYLH
jgi:hypothetical protein